MSGRLEGGGGGSNANGADDEEQRNGRDSIDIGITPGDGGEPTRESEDDGRDSAEESETERDETSSGRSGDAGITPGDGGEPTQEREDRSREDAERGGSERALDPGRADRAQAGRGEEVERVDATMADGPSRRRQLQRQAAAQTGADESQVTVVERDGELRAELTAEGRAQAAVASITRDRRPRGAGLAPGAALGPGQLALADVDRDDLETEEQADGTIRVSGPEQADATAEDERGSGIEQRLERFSDRFQAGVDRVEPVIMRGGRAVSPAVTPALAATDAVGVTDGAATEVTGGGATDALRLSDPAGIALSGIAVGRAGAGLQRGRVSSAQQLIAGEGDLEDVGRVVSPVGTAAVEEREAIGAAATGAARSARTDPVSAARLATATGGAFLLTGGLATGGVRAGGVAARAARGATGRAGRTARTSDFFADTRGQAQVPRGTQRQRQPTQEVTPATGRTTPDADPRIFEQARRRTGGRMADPGDPTVGTRPARTAATDRGQFRQQVQRARAMPDDDLRTVAAGDLTQPAASAGPTGTGPAAAVTLGARQRLETAQAPTVDQQEVLLGRAEDTSLPSAPTAETPGQLDAEATARELDGGLDIGLSTDRVGQTDLDAAAEQVTRGGEDITGSGTGQTTRTGQTGRTGTGTAQDVAPATGTGQTTGTAQTPRTATTPRPVSSTQPPGLTSGRPGSGTPRIPIPAIEPEFPRALPGIGQPTRRRRSRDAEIEFDVADPIDTVGEAFATEPDMEAFEP